MKLLMEVGLGPGYTALDGDTAPRFLAHIYCGQTAAWIKMPLGIEVDLGQGHIVLDVDPAARKGAQQLPFFSARLLWPRSPISATAELVF